MTTRMGNVCRCDVFDSLLFNLSFFPRDVLDELTQFLRMFIPSFSTFLTEMKSKSEEFAPVPQNAVHPGVRPYVPPEMA